MLFFGTRVQQEVADTIKKDFTVLHPSLIVYEQSCDAKTGTLTLITRLQRDRERERERERESSFIVGSSSEDQYMFFFFIKDSQMLATNFSSMPQQKHA